MESLELRDEVVHGDRIVLTDGLSFRGGVGKGKGEEAWAGSKMEVKVQFSVVGPGGGISGQPGGSAEPGDDGFVTTPTLAPHTGGVFSDQEGGEVKWA